MNDKTEQALTDALIDQIESAARASFRRHQSSIKGQILTAADNYDWHLLHAAYQAGIHAMRRQLADAQRDAERYSWLRMNRLWLKANLPTFAAPDFDATIDNAIDAAKGGADGIR